jgi:hypothetical protein
MAEQAETPPAPPPRPAPLTLPSPQQLGLTQAPATTAPAEQLDGNATVQQVHRLGATGFHVAQLPGGRCQVSLQLPAGQDHSEHVEATADSEAAAVRLALARAEQWASARR